VLLQQYLGATVAAAAAAAAAKQWHPLFIAARRSMILGIILKDSHLGILLADSVMVGEAIIDGRIAS
jgi:hypothetical protein